MVESFMLSSTHTYETTGVRAFQVVVESTVEE